jgi:signal peptidase I
VGGPAGYIVVAGTSMEPTYSDGTLVITFTGPSYTVGDVVAFAVDVGEGRSRPLVIHRIIGGDAAGGYVTQGDNRPFSDPWSVRPADIVGRAAFAVPAFGQALLFLRSPIMLASIGAALATYVVLGRRISPTPVRPGRSGEPLHVP